MKESRAHGHRRRALAVLLGVASLSAIGLAGCRNPGGGNPWQTTTTWGPTPSTDCHGHTDQDHANNQTTTTAGHGDHGGGDDHHAPGVTFPPCNGGGSTTTTINNGNGKCGKGRYVGTGNNGGGHGDHGDGGHGHEMPARLNHPPTAEQQAWARDVVARTKAYVQRNLRTTAQARAAGFNPIGDFNRHWTNARNRLDGCEFDETKIESLVADPITGRIVAAMYNMEPSTNVDNIPDWAGNWIVWHNHNNLCWKAPVGQPGWTELQLGGMVVNGRCTRGYVQDPPVLMVHVWIERHPCGAFAADGATPARPGDGSCLPNFQA